VNAHDYTSLFASLNEAVEILDRNRTPDPEFIAAYDTLKQSRAMLARVLTQARAAEVVGIAEHRAAA
jgi:hypothetical protein